MESIFCKNCTLSQEEFVMGNGITEPEYLKFIICPFEKQQYKQCDDICNHAKETYELLTILRNQ